MNVDDVRYLFAFDRWATARILAALDGIDEATWSATQVVDERGLGGILVHHLGATQRWRHGLLEDGITARPEKEPLPTPDGLRAWWAAEWPAIDAWLAGIDDAWLSREGDGVPFWQMLAHVVNHGTQHRSEAAAILTQAGRSPGDLDMIDFAEELAAARLAGAAGPDGARDSAGSAGAGS
jgi:uncharacterized damage-inducible protein DinB